MELEKEADMTITVAEGINDQYFGMTCYEL